MVQGCRIILTTTKPGIVLKHKDYENCSAHHQDEVDFHGGSVHQVVQEEGQQSHQAFRQLHPTGHKTDELLNSQA